MKFYGGIDLGARRSHICILNEEGEVKINRSLANDPSELLTLLGRFQPGLELVIESTFNWYWIVDLLQDHHFKVCLAHTMGLAMITKAKVKTDQRDAIALARTLRRGDIPEAFIFPRRMRGIRDLVRRRNQVVQQRGNSYGSLRRLLLRHGVLEHTRQSATKITDDDLETLLYDPLVVAYGNVELERIEFFTKQIASLEEKILSATSEHHNADFRRIQTLPGVGTFLGLTILFETGPVSRFSSSRRYSSYCRLVPGIYQSGSVRRRRGAQSKQGNPNLKWAYNQAAMYAIRYYDGPRKCFEKHLAAHAGPAGRVVVYNTVAHKLAVAAYRMLKDETNYREELAFGR